MAWHDVLSRYLDAVFGTNIFLILTNILTLAGGLIFLGVADILWA